MIRHSRNVNVECDLGNHIFQDNQVHPKVTKVVERVLDF